MLSENMYRLRYCKSKIVLDLNLQTIVSCRLSSLMTLIYHGLTLKHKSGSVILFTVAGHRIVMESTYAIVPIAC